MVPTEPTEFREDVRRMFHELDRTVGDDALAGECVPALDVFETDEAVEISMDLPGVSPAAVRIAAKGQTVLIVGLKAPRRTRPESTFHLVERGYGRFARAIRLSSPCDTNRARAVILNGELRVTIPRLQERRGRTIRIPISGDAPAARGESPSA